MALFKFIRFTCFFLFTGAVIVGVNAIVQGRWGLLVAAIVAGWLISMIGGFAHQTVVRAQAEQLRGWAEQLRGWPDV